MLIVNIHNVRWKKHYTQKEAIEQTGLGTETVNRLWKCKHYNFTIDTIERIAKFFGCNAKDLLVEVPDQE